MQKKYFFNYFVILTLILLLFTGCTEINGEKENVSIEDKVESEISYLEDEIFMIINKYTKKEYDKDGNVNWDDVSHDAQKVGKVLDTVMLDLSELNVSNDDLNKFRTEVNNLLTAVTKKDEYTLFKSASNLYGLLPGYYSKISKNKNKKEVLELKSLVLKSYTSAYFMEWDDSKANAALAETKYKEMSDNLEYMKEYSYNLNKTYILVEEFKNAVDLQELELTKIKYINFVEKV